LLLVTDVNSSMPNDQWQLTNVTWPMIRTNAIRTKSPDWPVLTDCC
jgi:hypothetical protein